MHEVTAFKNLVTTALEHMRAAGASQVTSVSLVLGASGHFDGDAARQQFAMVTKGTPLEGATLDIRWLPATFQCIDCQQRFEYNEAAEQIPCPHCGGTALEVEHQHICYVDAIEVAVDDDTSVEA